ncbi:hypothetical protein [Blastococcus tunisiensis]|uniref:hypothetical protein n=1 Tax=Blastococcus tunisiensis TaxID=1798228 RepID=UPI000B867B55|nr:hypothetical protein [Blastococcus sp. DSM 46838]
MLVAAFVLSCISLAVAIAGFLLAVRTFRRAGVRVRVSVSKGKAISKWDGTFAPLAKILSLTVTNTGLAKVEVSNPHWKVRGQKDVFIPSNTVGAKTIEGYHSDHWEYPVTIAAQMGVTKERSVRAQAGICLPDGRKVYSKTVKLGPEDLERSL